MTIYDTPVHHHDDFIAFTNAVESAKEQNLLSETYNFTNRQVTYSGKKGLISTIAEILSYIGYTIQVHKNDPDLATITVAIWAILLICLLQMAKDLYQNL